MRCELGDEAELTSKWADGQAAPPHRQQSEKQAQKEAAEAPHLARAGRRRRKHAQLLLGGQRSIQRQDEQLRSVGVGRQGAAALGDEPLAGFNLVLAGEEDQDVSGALVAVHLLREGAQLGQGAGREGVG